MLAEDSSWMCRLPLQVTGTTRSMTRRRRLKCRSNAAASSPFWCSALQFCARVSWLVPSTHRASASRARDSRKCVLALAHESTNTCDDSLAHHNRLGMCDEDAPAGVHHQGNTPNTWCENALIYAHFAVLHLVKCSPGSGLINASKSAERQRASIHAEQYLRVGLGSCV